MCISVRVILVSVCDRAEYDGLMQMMQARKMWFCTIADKSSVPIVLDYDRLYEMANFF